MWDNAPLLKNIANALFVFSALAVLYGAVHYVVHLPSLLPIRTVRLMNAPERVLPSEVLALVKIGVQGNFLTLDINRLRQSLEGLPWVRSVNIRREFPDGLDVQIEEHQAVAHWNDEALVDRQGEVFVAETEQPLPRFIGTEGSAAEVLDEYEALGRKLAVLNLHVTQIALSARHAWQLHLDDGTVVELGREALDERMTRFVNYQMSRNAAEGAARKAGDMSPAVRQGSVVDMRYRNGFAVRMTGKAEGLIGRVWKAALWGRISSRLCLLEWSACNEQKQGIEEPGGRTRHRHIEDRGDRGRGQAGWHAGSDRHGHA